MKTLYESILSKTRLKQGNAADILNAELAELANSGRFDRQEVFTKDYKNFKWSPDLMPIRFTGNGNVEIGGKQFDRAPNIPTEIFKYILNKKPKTITIKDCPSLQFIAAGDLDGHGVTIIYDSPNNDEFPRFSFANKAKLKNFNFVDIRPLLPATAVPAGDILSYQVEFENCTFKTTRLDTYDQNIFAISDNLSFKNCKFNLIEKGIDIRSVNDKYSNYDLYKIPGLVALDATNGTKYNLVPADIKKIKTPVADISISGLLGGKNDLSKIDFIKLDFNYTGTFGYVEGIAFNKQHDSWWMLNGDIMNNLQTKDGWYIHYKLGKKLYNKLDRRNYIKGATIINGYKDF